MSYGKQILYYELMKFFAQIYLHLHLMCKFYVLLRYYSGELEK